VTATDELLPLENTNRSDISSEDLRLPFGKLKKKVDFNDHLSKTTKFVKRSKLTQKVTFKSNEGL
jgi:hypothetical protein